MIECQSLVVFTDSSAPNTTVGPGVDAPVVSEEDPFAGYGRRMRRAGPLVVFLVRGWEFFVQLPKNAAYTKQSLQKAFVLHVGTSFMQPARFSNKATLSRPQFFSEYQAFFGSDAVLTKVEFDSTIKMYRRKVHGGRGQNQRPRL